MALQIGPSPLEAFQVGQQLRGPSALGQVAMALTQQLMQQASLRQQARIETDEKIRSAGPIAEAEAKAKAQYDPMTAFLLGGQSGTTVGNPMERLRQVPLQPGESVTMGPFRRESPSPTMERGQAVQSAQTVMSTIKGFRKRILPEEGGNPDSLLFRGIPGVPGAMSTGLDFDTLKLEIVTARGGKQLTPSEQQLIQRVIPDRAMVLDAKIRAARGDQDPYSTIRDSLSRLENISRGLIDYFDPNTGQADLSKIEQESGQAPVQSMSLQDQARRELQRRRGLR